MLIFYKQNDHKAITHQFGFFCLVAVFFVSSQNNQISPYLKHVPLSLYYDEAVQRKALVKSHIITEMLFPQTWQLLYKLCHLHWLHFSCFHNPTLFEFAWQNHPYAQFSFSKNKIIQLKPGFFIHLCNPNGRQNNSCNNFNSYTRIIASDDNSYFCLNM